MRLIATTPLILAAALLAGCANPDRFGNGGGFPDTGGVGALPGANGVTSGSLDPTSPAYFTQNVGDRVLFAVDQSTLGDEARQTLAAQAAWLQQNPSYTAVIEGHADEQGTREYNLALGARRAASARDYLVSQGIQSSRLRTVTFGKERPIEVCSSESCYTQNRRAVTVVAAGGLTS